MSGSAGLSANDLKPVLANKGILDGTAETFISASNNSNVNEVYLVAHAFLETGNGGSTLANGIYVDQNGNVLRDSNGNLITKSSSAPSGSTKVYNMFGIAAYDSNPINGATKKAFQEGWTTKEKAIIGGAKWISNKYMDNKYNQNTLYKMKWNPISPGTHQYATDIGWPSKQVARIKSLYDMLPNATLNFDIPKFK
nr:glucosaminidase domain-containing protein [Aquibacillus saliphilus]